MNPLNSILFEGKVVKKPSSVTSITASSCCFFEVEATRSITIDKKPVIEVVKMTIQANNYTADKCLKILKVDSEVRIVGRLCQMQIPNEDASKRSQVIIVAEHVEFKPVPPKEKVS